METQSSKSQNMREFRRLRAVELFESGMKQVDIARALGVTKGAVSQWLSVYRKNGLDALRYRKIAKKPCKLSDEQKNKLSEFLAMGPEHFGYAGQVWTLPRIGELILHKFGIKYCQASVCRIMKKIGWTCQKPVVRAVQRDDEARENGFRKNGQI